MEAAVAMEMPPRPVAGMDLPVAVATVAVAVVATVGAEADMGAEAGGKRRCQVPGLRFAIGDL
jgi:hypothetical protein